MHPILTKFWKPRFLAALINGVRRMVTHLQNGIEVEAVAVIGGTLYIVSRRDGLAVTFAPDPFYRQLDQVLRELAGVRTDIGTLLQQGVKTMADLSNLQAEVEATKGAEDSAIVLINQLIAAVQAAGTDQAALDALTADLAARREALAAAVAANPA